MNRDEIIRMAREAGYGDSMSDLHAATLERFAALVAAHEREECVSKIFKLFAENRQFKAAVTVAQYFRGKK